MCSRVRRSAQSHYFSPVLSLVTWDRKLCELSPVLPHPPDPGTRSVQLFHHFCAVSSPPRCKYPTDPRARPQKDPQKTSGERGEIRIHIPGISFKGSAESPRQLLCDSLPTSTHPTASRTARDLTSSRPDRTERRTRTREAAERALTKHPIIRKNLNKALGPAFVFFLRLQAQTPTRIFLQGIRTDVFYSYFWVIT